MKYTLLTCLVVLLSMSISAQINEKELCGIWISDKGNAKYEFYESDHHYYAKITWLKEPKEEAKIDDVVVKKLTYNKQENLFEDGTFYWGDNTLNCEIKLLNNKELQMKITRLLFSREIIWRKVN